MCVPGAAGAVQKTYQGKSFVCGTNVTAPAGLVRGCGLGPYAQMPQLLYTLNFAVNQFGCGSAARISKPRVFINVLIGSCRAGRNSVRTFSNSGESAVPSLCRWVCESYQQTVLISRCRRAGAVLKLMYWSIPRCETTLDGFYNVCCFGPQDGRVMPTGLRGALHTGSELAFLSVNHGNGRFLHGVTFLGSGHPRSATNRFKRVFSSCGCLSCRT